MKNKFLTLDCSVAGPWWWGGGGGGGGFAGCDCQRFRLIQINGLMLGLPVSMHF